MKQRTGEKIGWSAGWGGAFLWVAILSVVFLVQHQTSQGIIGLILFAAAVCCIILCAPWRRPSTAYWKLMLPLYAILLGSAGWAVWAFGGPENAGFSWWMLLWLLPLLIPFGTGSQRRWTDSEV